MNNSDKDKLRQYLQVLNQVMCDLDDAMSDGYMSDAKSAVHQLPDKLKALGLSNAGVAEELEARARDCWDSMYRGSGSSDAWARAGRAAAAIGRLERLIRALLEDREESAKA